MDDIVKYPYFPISDNANSWLLPLSNLGRGIEIGKSAHNDFFIPNCINMDYNDSLETVFKKEEIRLCGQAAKVDVVGFADRFLFQTAHLCF